jgi:hypothetical protein
MGAVKLMLLKSFSNSQLCRIVACLITSKYCNLAEHLPDAMQVVTLVLAPGGGSRRDTPPQTLKLSLAKYDSDVNRAAWCALPGLGSCMYKL